MRECSLQCENAQSLLVLSTPSPIPLLGALMLALGSDACHVMCAQLSARPEARRRDHISVIVSPARRFRRSNPLLRHARVIRVL
jgi:hypothetical protein